MPLTTMKLLSLREQALARTAAEMGASPVWCKAVNAVFDYLLEHGLDGVKMDDLAIIGDQHYMGPLSVLRPVLSNLTTGEPPVFTYSFINGEFDPDWPAMAVPVDLCYRLISDLVFKTAT